MLAPMSADALFPGRARSPREAMLHATGVRCPDCGEKRTFSSDSRVCPPGAVYSIGAQCCGFVWLHYAAGPGWAENDDFYVAASAAPSELLTDPLLEELFAEAASDLARAQHGTDPETRDALVQQSAREALALLVELEKREPSRAAGAAERKRALAGAYVEAGGVLPEEMEPLAAGVPRPPSTDWAAMPCDTLLEGIGRYANPRLALRMIAASPHRHDPAVAERRRAHLYALERFDEYVRAIEGVALDSNTRHQLVVALLSLGRAAEAEPHARASIAALPRFAPARAMLAYVLAALGRRADADREIEALVALEDRFGATAAMAEEFERHDGDWARAREARRRG
jgi:tetratricopeptide (TPR) repeat protein